MRHMSARRRAALPLRLMALASLALISGAGLSRAADRCPDIAQSVQMLHEGDQYQAASLLFAAARFGCEGQARALLDRGAAIDAKDREGATALAKAAEADKLKLMKLLLERGADPNARAVDGSTPLFYAAKEDRARRSRCCSSAAPIPTFPERRGSARSPPRPITARRTASMRCSNTAPTRTRSTTTGKSAMVYAAGHAYAPVVALLLQAGVDVNRRYAHGLTALMWAAGHDASAGVEDVDATIKTLIAHGAALDLKDDRGKTPATIARGLGDERAAKMLEKKGRLPSPTGEGLGGEGSRAKRAGAWRRSAHPPPSPGGRREGRRRFSLIDWSA